MAVKLIGPRHNQARYPPHTTSLNFQSRITLDERKETLPYKVVEGPPAVVVNQHFWRGRASSVRVPGNVCVYWRGCKNNMSNY